MASNGTITAGELAGLAVVRDATANTVAGYLNAVLGESVTDTTTGTSLNARPLRFGATALATPSHFLDGIIYGMAIFRTALSAADLATAAEELMGDEATALALMYLGSGGVDALYVGSTAASAAYLGTTQVF